MGYTAAQASVFINQIAPLIRAEATKRGYKICSTVIAQAIIESACATSSLGYKYHNYFGMKCGNAWTGKSVNLKTKEEYKVGQLTTIKDNFRAYDSMAAGVAGYYDFISTKRYVNLKTAETHEQYAQLLKSDGYATSSTYVNTLCSTVKKYGLAVYDSVTGQVPASAIQSDTYPAYTGTSQSIVSSLAEVGERDTSLAHRRQIAAANGVTSYVGSVTQNLTLVKKLKAGVLKRA